jgi:hypothetical protein
LEIEWATRRGHLKGITINKTPVMIWRVPEESVVLRAAITRHETTRILLTQFGYWLMTVANK